jgi:6-phosphogluconate dehydrogenase
VATSRHATGPPSRPGEQRKHQTQSFLSCKRSLLETGELRPCLAKLAPGGCVHNVKMTHNDIKHAMMTALCEAWAIFDVGLDLSYDSWRRPGGLEPRWPAARHLPCRHRRPDLPDPAGRAQLRDGHSPRPVLSNVRDKIVQDVDNSEGTGTWTVLEGVTLHVPHPTVAASHPTCSVWLTPTLQSAKQLRRHSGVDRCVPAESRTSPTRAASSARTCCRRGYASFLLSFVQGLHILQEADAQHGWHLNFVEVLQI